MKGPVLGVNPIHLGRHRCPKKHDRRRLRCIHIKFQLRVSLQQGSQGRETEKRISRKPQGFQLRQRHKRANIGDLILTEKQNLELRQTCQGCNVADLIRFKG